MVQGSSALPREENWEELQDLSKSGIFDPYEPIFEEVYVSNNEAAKILEHIKLRKFLKWCTYKPILPGELILLFLCIHRQRNFLLYAHGISVFVKIWIIWFLRPVLYGFLITIRNVHSGESFSFLFQLE